MFRPVVVALAAVSVLLASWAAVSQPWQEPPRRMSATQLTPSLRLGIVPAAAGVSGKWLLHRGAGSVLFSDTGMALHLPSAGLSSRQVGWRVAGARAVTPRAERQQPGAFHRMSGPQETWETNLPIYSGLRYPGVLPGVDLWFEARDEGLEYGFRAERGRDLRQVRLEYSGARALRVVGEGRALEADLEEGSLREEGLRCWQEALDGTPREVGCHFAEARETRRGQWEYAIVVDVVDPERPVVVDPTIRWLSYQADDWKDELGDLVRDPKTGDIYVTGSVTVSLPPKPLHTDVFVARFNEEGKRLWAGAFGGDGKDDHGTAIALAPDGGVYIAGSTASPNLSLPLPDGGAGSKLLGAEDSFIARIDEPAPTSSNPTARWLLHVGGDGGERFNDLLLHGDTLYAAGETDSAHMPNSALIGRDVPGGKDAFVASVNATTLEFVTVLLRGSKDEAANAVSISSFRVVFTGTTSSLPDGSPSPDKNLFVSSFLPGNNSPHGMVTNYLGGPGDDEGQLLVSRDSVEDELTLAGTTASNAFAGDAGIDGETDIFTLRLVLDPLGHPTLSEPLLIRGPGKQEVFDAVYDPRGHRRILLLGGRTNGVFVTPDAFDQSLEDGGTDGFVVAVDLEVGSEPTWATLIGGTGPDAVHALQIDPHGRLFIGGTAGAGEGMPGDAGVSPPKFTNGSNMFLMAVETDTTKPEVEGAVVYDMPLSEDGGDHEVQADTKSLSASWAGFYDPESGVIKYTYVIRDQKDRTDVRGLGNAVVDDGGVLTVGSLNLVPGRTYEFVIVAHNRAGLFNEQFSNGVYILPGEPDGGGDTTPPETVNAEVLDGLAAVDLDEQTDRTTLSATWTGFEDPESGSLEYECIAREVDDPSKVLGTKRVATSPVTFTGLELVVDREYEVVVRAYNEAGLSAEKSSDGVFIRTEPEPEPDAGTGADAGENPKPEAPRSPMGYSCGCTSFQGSGGVVLGALLGLALLTSRRRRASVESRE